MSTTTNAPQFALVIPMQDYDSIRDLIAELHDLQKNVQLAHYDTPKGWITPEDTLTLSCFMQQFMKAAMNPKRYMRKE
jgi:hypothetical protein